MVTGFVDVSPLALIVNEPRMPLLTRVLNSCFVTSARVPFECSIAEIRTSAACAA